ncbi:MAG: insulinase family protein [Myxococcales bacterium FL481]|nr:MAG: insulinase family protein [Myxococcales bacterium FL481]
MERTRSGFDANADEGHVCAIELWISSGTASERASEHGCAHLIEHMLFKPWGADEPGPRPDLAHVIESLGGDVNAYTSHDETVFYATSPAAGWAQTVSAVLDAVFNREFDTREFEHERDVVLEEISQYQDDPWSRASQQLWTRMFSPHAYGRPVLGTATEVRAHKVAALRGYYRRHYRPANATLVVVGPMTTRAVRQLVAAWPGDDSAATSRARRRALSSAVTTTRAEATRDHARRMRTAGRRRLAAAERQVGVLREDISEPHVLVGWPTPALTDDDCVPLELAAVILGSGDASRLVSVVRREQGLATEIGASLSTSQRASALIVHAHAAIEGLDALRTAIEDQVRDLSAHGPTPEEFARAVAVLDSTALYRRETAQGRAHALGYFATGFGDPSAEAEFSAQLNQLRPEDVRRACARYLTAERACLVASLPRSGASSARAAALRRGWSKPSAPVRSRRRTTPRGFRPGQHPLQLDSGLRVIGRADDRVPLVAGWLVWPGGTAREPAQLAGIASLAANLLLRGTSGRSGNALARELDTLAAGVEPFCGRNSLGLQFECRAGDLPVVLRRVFECASSSTFPDPEVEDWRRATLTDLAAEADDLGQVAHREMLRLLYGAHPYHRDSRGRAATLTRITARDVRRYWDSSYGLGHAVLGLAGDFDPIAVPDLLERLTGAASNSAPTPPEIDPPVFPSRAKTRRLDKAREQAHVARGFPGLPLGDADTAALDVLTAVLGSQSGRLFAALREREGLVYHVGVHSAEALSGGHVVVSAATSQATLDRAIDRIDEELARVLDSTISPAELGRAQRWLIGQHHNALQRRSRVAANLAFSCLYDLGPSYYFDYARKVSGVDAKRVAAVAERVFRAKSATAIVRDAHHRRG